jgi:hypothetical protein
MKTIDVIRVPGLRMFRHASGSHLLRVAAVLAPVAFAAASMPALAQGRSAEAQSRFGIETLSTKPDRVSGGNVLVQISYPGNERKKPLPIKLNGQDVSASFKPGKARNSLMGLVVGLRVGKNVLEVDGRGWGLPNESIEITNYSIDGPITSGPRMEPFVCQTASFRLPDGTTLGAHVDPVSCSAPTKVVYVYRSSTTNAFTPLPAGSALPADVATTTTTAGQTVPFVVRVETGTMGRGIYQNVILHDPTTEAAPTPFSPPKGWNGRLIGMHGSGCAGGWNIQGGALGVNLLDAARLGEGYALFANTLNHPTNSCNPVLAGEVTMMGKEHFIETVGLPAFTVSTGCSGGAYTSLQVADALPGLFDGVLINCTYPDALSIALSGMDSRLLTNYLFNNNAAGFTLDQMVAVSGHKNARAWYDLALQMGRTDPVPNRVDPIPPSPLMGGYRSAVWNPVVPVDKRYDPVTNPTGARPTVFDVARNMYGRDPSTGFALRPFDNVGVQYGLEALNAGVITPAQFIHLNENIGGFDHDSSFVAGRTTGDLGAIRRAYQSGITLGGGGGLASIPVFDTTIIYDDDQFYHYQWFHFATRERMRKQNGHTDNHVMWRGGAPITALFGQPDPIGNGINATVATESWKTFIEWVSKYRADHSNAPTSVKVVRNKPAAAVDGCFTQSLPTQFVAETQTFSSQPDSHCNTLWPSYSFPRKEAGGTLDANVLKCQLKPVDPSDYAVAFSPDETARLRSIFPSGVCDWTKPGVNQVPVVTWGSFGPAPEKLVFDVTKP